ncbi:MAG: major facilitator superfamily protein [Gammaproteobacteria bacterium]|nr:MAG: major facilitator superfamily protein [Gammaproteobacteria bacterium]TND02644.1 MAG: major facilitator superfamily protein [Gammaproteobacteria bacterium]
MTPRERRAAISLAGIFSLRMLGLFMILPVFALYASDHLSDATPTLIGVAIGAYGLTQAVLQIPFGMLSDRIGRKPVIVFGLIVFAIGSVVAAMSDTIIGVIIGRALQGSGAIAAAVMALAADLTREEHRTKAMAMIGASIGVSFAVSMILGPVFNHWFGVPGIFWLTAALALGGIAVVRYAVPQPVRTTFHRDAQTMPAQLKTALVNPELLRLDFGIFVLHMLLTATFVAFPLMLRDQGGLDAAHHWMVYAPVLLIGLVAMVPFVIIAEKMRRMKQVFVAAILVIAASELGLAFFDHSFVGMVAGLFIFFTAFNVLEATLPSLVAKTAPGTMKGTAMGIYSSAQFLGAFCGGVAGGALYGTFGVAAVFVFCAVAAMAWAAVAMTMAPPRYVASLMLNVGQVNEARARQLATELLLVRGVEEAVVIVEDGVAYLKVDNRILDREAVFRFSVDGNSDGDSATDKQAQPQPG